MKAERLCFLALADQSPAQIVGIFQVLREVLIMMLPLVLLLEYGHGIARIVGELVGITGIERLTAQKRPHLPMLYAVHSEEL